MNPVPLADPSGRLRAWMCGCCNHVGYGSEAMYRNADEHTLASIYALLDTVRTSKGLARIKAAEAILDRVGLPKVQKVEGTVAPALDLSKLSDEELDALSELTEKATVVR